MSYKKVIRKILQNSPENIFVGVSFLNKVADLQSATLLIKTPYFSSGVFLQILRNFEEQLFHGASLSGCF